MLEMDELVCVKTHVHLGLEDYVAMAIFRPAQAANKEKQSTSDKLIFHGPIDN